MGLRLAEPNYGGGMTELRNVQADLARFRNRVFVISVVVLCCFVLLAIRLIYLQVVRGKTAALFAAACEVGGVIAGADEAQIMALHRYGDALGISFQIIDDLLDYSGSSAAIGKNVGDDFRERKLTLPLIKAVAKADAATAASRKLENAMAYGQD